MITAQLNGPEGCFSGVDINSSPIFLLCCQHLIHCGFLALFQWLDACGILWRLHAIAFSWLIYKKYIHMMAAIWLVSVYIVARYSKHAKICEVCSVAKASCSRKCPGVPKDGIESPGLLASARLDQRLRPLAIGWNWKVKQISTNQEKWNKTNGYWLDDC